MAYVITDHCATLKDGACIAVCPVDCIHPTEDEQDFDEAEILYINPATCIDCGLCVDECPVDAIFPADQLPEEHIRFAWINAAYYEGGRV